MPAQLASRSVANRRRRKDLEDIAAHLRAALDRVENLQGENAAPAAAEPELATVLLDVNEVAGLLGLTRGTIAEYRNRPALGFPPPALAKNHGRFLLWWKHDVIAWREAHPGRQP